jgi:hypothetical protein
MSDDKINEVEWRENWQRAYDEWRENGHPLMLLEGYQRPKAPLWVRIANLAVWLAIGAIVLWAGVDALSDTMKAPERERRIEACAVGMTRSTGDGPVEACKGLSEDEKREASYEYLKRVGWL